MCLTLKKKFFLTNFYQFFFVIIIGFLQNEKDNTVSCLCS